MAKGKTSKKHKIGHANFASNRVRRIKTEANRVEKKMKKLLKLFEEGRERHCGDKVRTIQGIKPGSSRHQNLKEYVKMLRSKVKGQ